MDGLGEEDCNEFDENNIGGGKLPTAFSHSAEAELRHSFDPTSCSSRMFTMSLAC
jgi:hypothetical protein